jgi:alkylation response protein AidB-like acyl-CoA dehydrogenase
MRRTVYDPEHEQFREVVREFIAREVAPHGQAWEQAGIVDREVYRAAGKHGVIGFNIPEEFGGGGVADFRFNAVLSEELAKAGPGAPAFTLHNDVVAPYLITLATPEQQQRWLPGFAAGDLIGAIAMTEPGAGSDLAGVRTHAALDGGTWILSGAKTFISSGINADLVIVVTRTGRDPAARHRAFSLLVVERGMPGFSRGRNLDKIGLKSQDTAELFFDEVPVPAANVLGTVGRGFYHLMHNLPAERMTIAISAVAGARAVFDETLAYAKNRTAFGQPIGSFQHNRFVLAELDTELDIAQVFVDRCLEAIVAGELSAVEAAKAKWWTTELQKRVIDACVQLHGGYGYMLEYPVARAYLDARVQTIYGGTTEIMKEIVGRNLGV